MGWVEGGLRRARAELERDIQWLWHGGDRSRRAPWLRRAIVIAIALFVVLPIVFLIVFRFLPVPATPEMLLRLATLQPVRHEWVSFGAISPKLARAVIGGEDENFCSHSGFDWKSIDEAWKSHKRHPRRRLRGASTISQQTARTLFLVSARSWIRKGAEAYFTVLLEALWPKKRILTAYLNLVDWGHGNFGAEAAAESYFHKPAAALSASEAARLAAILPDPDKWQAVDPGPYVAARTGTLEARSGSVTRDDLDSCVKR